MPGRALAAARLAGLCLVQDPAGYGRSAAGSALTADDGGWPSRASSTPFGRCLQARRFLDKSLCDDITAVTPSPDEVRFGQALVAAMDRHAAAQAAVGDVFHLQDVADAAASGFACPATLPHPAR